MQLKKMSEVTWNDMPKIESPFFAVSRVRDAFLGRGFHSVSGISSWEMDSHFSYRSKEDQLRSLIRDVEIGRCYLVADKPFSPLFRWIEDEEREYGGYWRADTVGDIFIGTWAQYLANRVRKPSGSGGGSYASAVEDRLVEPIGAKWVDHEVMKPAKETPVKIIKAYFAREKEVTVTQGKTASYSMKNPHRTPKGSDERRKVVDYIYKHVSTPAGMFTTKEAIDTVLPEDCTAGMTVKNIPLYAKEKRYEKVTEAEYGKETFIAVETELPATPLKVKIKEKEPFFAIQNAALPLLRDGSQNDIFSVTTDAKGKAAFKLQLRPKSTNDYIAWEDKYYEKEEEVTNTLYIEVAETNGEYTSAADFNLTHRRVAPWMRTALHEYMRYGNKNEATISNRIAEYHASPSSDAWLKKPDGSLKLPEEVSWCGSFVSWCFDNTKGYEQTNFKLGAVAYDWGPAGNEKAKTRDPNADGWPNGEEITKDEDVFYGAVYVKSPSHVGFIVGIDEKRKKYLVLGGNQGNSISLSSYDISAKYVIMKPKKYAPKDYEKSLPKINSADYEEKSTS